MTYICNILLFSTIDDPSISLLGDFLPNPSNPIHLYHHICTLYWLCRQLGTFKFTWLDWTAWVTTDHTNHYQTSRSCATARPAVIDSGGPSSIVKSPNIRCFVAKSGLSRFTRFLGVRFSAFDRNRYCQIGQWCYYYWFDIDSQSVLSIANLFYW